MLRTITAASADPVSLAEAKAQLRITDASQDALITALVSAATLSAQAQVQRLFVQQQVEWVLQGWLPCIELPIAPVYAAVGATSGVVSIKYMDWATMAVQTLDPALYVVQTKGPSVQIFPTFGTIWPILFPYSPEPVVIRFNVGDAPGAVANNVKQAILLTVRHLYSLGEQNIFVKRDRVDGVGEKYMQVDPGSVSLLPDAALYLLTPEMWS